MRVGLTGSGIFMPAAAELHLIRRPLLNQRASGSGHEEPDHGQSRAAGF